ncbi:MAG: lytic transglycosylase domain-containing protein [Nannocystaceae bacterium]|nr:lytic transglycosylase domain-containing protein [Nannocystaceae bacterium]
MTRARRNRATGLALVLALASCHRETPAVALQVDAVDGGEATPSPAQALVSAPGRELWFAEGPGREAILARERGDHARARTELEALLAQDSISAADRGAAELLLALEDLAAGDRKRAVQRLEQARSAAALAAIEPRLRLLQAQALLDDGEPAAALALVEALPLAAVAGSSLAGDRLVVLADAKLRSHDEAGARADYRRYLAEHPRGDRRAEVETKLARTLAASTADAERDEAIALYEGLLMSVPLSDFGEEAARELPRLQRARAAGPTRGGAAARAFERQAELARIDALVDRSRYRQAIKAADAFLALKGTTPLERCRALFDKGTAVFKQRERAKARPQFEAAVAQCKAAGDDGTDLGIKAAYQAARGRYAEGKHAAAAAEFEALAAIASKHSFGDDAWVLAGESWAEAGDDAAARKAWERALALSGDMAEEARRRLLVAAFVRGDAPEVLRLCDDGLAAKWLGAAERGKLLYFRGRALQRMGDEAGARTAYLAVLDAGPLEYPALQALSRLRELGDAAWAEATAKLEGVGSDADAPATPADEAALMLARLGLGQWAQDELESAKIDGWPAVLVLNQAGLYTGAQKLLAKMGSAWRSTPPGRAWSKYRAAHPQPFVELIAPGEPRLGVPQWLTYAIMQTESRFDPSATSFAGARGLIQLMPSTARAVAKQAGVALDDEDALYDPATNLEIGMHHLASLVARFGGSDGAVALAIPSYNAGAGAVEKWLDEHGSLDLDVFIEGIPYDETRKYTQSVLGRWLAYRLLYRGEAPLAERLPYLALTLSRG